MALGPGRTRGMGPLIRIPLMTWEDCVLATLDSSQPLTDFVIGGAHVRLFLKGDGVASLGSSPKSSTPNLSLTHCICLWSQYFFLKKCVSKTRWWMWGWHPQKIRQLSAIYNCFSTGGDEWPACLTDWGIGEVKTRDRKCTWCRCVLRVQVDPMIRPLSLQVDLILLVESIVTLRSALNKFTLHSSNHA